MAFVLASERQEHHSWGFEEHGDCSAWVDRAFEGASGEVCSDQGQ